MSGRAVFLALLMLAMAGARVRAGGFDAFDEAAIEPKLGAQLPQAIIMVDEAGTPAPLAEYLGAKPVILAPVDFDCVNICGVTLAGLFTALGDIDLDPGAFEVLAISIDPRETPADAVAARTADLARFAGSDTADAVRFLVGKGAGSTRRLMDAIGFHYAFDATTDQFAHPAAVAVITAGGRLARWLYGYPFEPSDLRLALVEAGEGTIGTLSDRLWLLCYGYDPKTGTYTADITIALKMGGAVTILLVGGLVAVLLRRERHRSGDRP